MQNDALKKIAQRLCVRGLVVAVGATLLLPFTTRVQAAGRQVLHGQVPAIATRLLPVGNLPGTNQLDLAIGLSLRNREALTNLLRQIYDPAGPNYHHSLTPEQFAARFGPTEQDYAAVMAFAKAQGLRVTATHPNRMLVDVNGSAAEIISSDAMPTDNPTLSGVPVITGFSPASGIPGMVVTIVGTNFSSVNSNDVVYFGAVQATVTAASETNLVVAVPVGATYAPITVTVNGLTTYANAPFEPTFLGNSSSINGSSFVPRFNLVAGGGPIRAVIADLDGDGKPDLAIGNVWAGTISVYRNISTNGVLTAASFAPRVDLPVLPSSGTSPYIIAVADVDGDGKLDLIALNADSDVVSILRNVSTPGSLTTNSFAARIDLPAGDVMRGLAVADLNGDGKPDIVTASQTTPGTISMFQNLSTVGNIAFAPRVDFAAGNGPFGVAIGDLDGDGKPDVAVVNRDSATISVFRNLGMGGDITTNSFAPKVDFPALATCSPIAIGDVDGDGRLDLVVGGAPNSQAISVYRNTATVGSITTNSFAPRVDFGAGGWVNELALGDLDGDGKPDIGLVSQMANYFSIFKNLSVPGSFTSNSLAARVDYTAGSATGSNPNGVAMGDLDGDGRPDIVFANQNDGTISIYQNEMPFGGLPVITMQPTNQTVLAGGAVSFSVTVSGTLPLSYQWEFNGTNLPGAINPTLMLTDVQFNQAGIYAVLITNLYGSILSSNVLLTVDPPLPCDPAPLGLVSWWPGEGNAQDIIGGSNGIVYPGTTFSAGMVGQAFNFDGVNGCVMNTNTPPLTNIQNSFTTEFWAYPEKGFTMLPEGGGEGISGQGYAIFPDWGGTDGKAGAGVCVGTNGISVVEHADNYMPSMLSYTNSINGWTHIAVVYSNKQPVLYVNGVNVRTGITSTRSFVYPSKNLGSSYGVIGNAQFKSYGPYAGLLDEVSIYNRALSQSEIQAIYSADGGGKCPLTPPVITVQPMNQMVTVGGTASFSVTASGTWPLSYQWNFNGTNLSGATNTTLTLTNVRLSQAGNYAVLVTNQYGSAVSSNAVLTVGTPPTITMQPASQRVTPGCSATFSVGASGTGPLHYQWWNSTSTLGSQTNSTLTLSNVQVTDFTNYYVIVTNGFGSVTSSNAVLLQNHPPVAVQDIIRRFATSDVKVQVSTLLTNDVDADGDQLTFLGVSSNSAAGGTVSWSGNWVYYLPPAGYTNSDAFTYSISDGYCGGLSTGYVLVQIMTPEGPSHNFVIHYLPDGSVQLIFAGIPGWTYRIQYTDTLPPINWVDLATNTADATGVFQYIDRSPTNGPTRFYRSVSP